MGYLYSGINSVSLLAGILENGEFDKRLIPSMKRVNQLYTYRPPIDIKVGQFRFVQGTCVGRVAYRRSEKYGGIPVVFSIDEDILEEIDWQYEIKNGVRPRRILLPTQRAFRIQNIYRVIAAKKNTCTCLKEMSLEELVLSRYNNEQSSQDEVLEGARGAI